MSQDLGLDWHSSPAHMFLLGHFLDPNRVEELTTRVDWAQALGEEPEAVAEQLLAAGLLEYADHDQPLDSRLAAFTVQELREMLSQRDLPVYGRKDELISRLIEADVEGMEEAAQESSALQCSERGRTAIEAYLLAGGMAVAEAEVQPVPSRREGRGRPFGWPVPHLNTGAARRESDPQELELEGTRSEPSDSDIRSAQEHVRQGCAYGCQGDFDQALAEFGQAIKLNPRYALPHFWRGVTYGRLGDYQRALVEYHHAIGLDPDPAEFYVGRGYAYRALGDPWLAIQDYDAAIEGNPKLAVAHHNRGVAYEHLGDYRRALVDYRQASSLQPESAEPHFGLGVVYEQAGANAQAAAEFQMVLKLSDKPDILDRARKRLQRLQVDV